LFLNWQELKELIGSIVVYFTYGGLLRSVAELTNEKFGAADQKVLIPAVVNMVEKDVQEIEEMKKVKKFE
jgi:hypothetical protein